MGDPKLPEKKEDAAQAKKDLAAIRKETFELKLDAAKSLKKQIEAQKDLIKDKAAPADGSTVTPLQLKLIELNEKIIAEILEMLRSFGIK